MIFSMYPTDSADFRERIVRFCNTAGNSCIYTSLHIPEADNLKTYLNELKRFYIEQNVTFFADISPLTLKFLDIELEKLESLKNYGIIGIRIDFGFSLADIKQICRQGFKVAVNASVVSEDFLKSMEGYSFVGWHNYYPRPGTGITDEFFKEKNELFFKYGIELYAFIPGENNLRAPLNMGLPTLEKQRHRNCYINAVEMLTKYPEIKLVLAEGECSKNHYDWIQTACNNKVLTIPLTLISTEEIAQNLTKKDYRVRVEESESVWRIEDTRGTNVVPKLLLQADKRLLGSLQMETGRYGRYEGEISIMKKDMPLDVNMVRIAEIPTPYLKLVEFLTTEFLVRFVKI